MERCSIPTGTTDKRIKFALVVSEIAGDAGVVENMSGGMFGTGAGEELAHEMGLPFLGRVTMREVFLDPKQPAVLESDEVADEFSEIALKVRQMAQSAV